MEKNGRGMLLGKDFAWPSPVFFFHSALFVWPESGGKLPFSPDNVGPMRLPPYQAVRLPRKLMGGCNSLSF